MTLVGEYNNSIQGLEPIFEVPEQLRRLFVEAFDRAINTEDLPNSVKQRLTNQQAVFLNIRDGTLGTARKKYLGQLYEYGVIFVSSVSEQILKSVFNNLIIGNLARIKLETEFTVSYTDLKQNNFQLDEAYWASLLVSDLFDSKNPQEKANFQNLKAVESLFKNYFGIDFLKNDGYLELSKKIHLYFQMRHILVHNQGIIDDRFLANITKAGIQTAPRFAEGQRLRITRTHFEECKSTFYDFFKFLDSEISESKLNINKLEILE